MTTRTARDALLKAKWGEGLDRCVIIVRDRLSPTGVSGIAGSAIEGIGTAYLELDQASIPYHRIMEIRRDGDVLWKRSVKR